MDRIGGTKSIKTNFRVIAATNKNLEESIEKGDFRKDLYYRLNVVRVEIPLLKQRQEDVLFLVDSFLERKSKELGDISIRISPHAIECLKSYEYPGNVRELINVLERAINKMDVDIISGNPIKITEETVRSVLYPPSPDNNDRRYDFNITPYEQSKYGSINDLKVLKQDQEIEAIKRAIELTDGNMTKSAKLLGIHRTVIHRKIKNYKLTPYVINARKKKLEHQLAIE